MQSEHTNKHDRSWLCHCCANLGKSLHLSEPPSLHLQYTRPGAAEKTQTLCTESAWAGYPAHREASGNGSRNPRDGAGGRNTSVWWSTRECIPGSCFLKLPAAGRGWTTCTPARHRRVIAEADFAPHPASPLALPTSHKHPLPVHLSQCCHSKENHSLRTGQGRGLRIDLKTDM